MRLHELFEQIENTSLTEDSDSEPKDPELWKKAIEKAKETYDKYPSAYANMFAAKWYKEQGGEWKTVNENLDDWLDQNWVDISRPKKGGGFEPCGASHDDGSRGDSGDRAYPKCVPANKAAKMSQKEIDSAVRRKRKAVHKDKTPNDPTWVSTKPKK